MLMLYIPICDCVVYLFLHGLVGSAHAREQRVPGSIPDLIIAGIFFFVSYYCILISKDGCEKGRCDPKVLDINALVGVQEFT